ncbi:MAG: deoxynucleoside kinase [Caldilinea sp.]|jgi:deoxyadenosine/deoxycytidine kinase|nr:deoxynucleoside kinase [Caldilinea sp.]
MHCTKWNETSSRQSGESTLGKLIAVIGNTAVGKTTLVSQLITAAPFVTGLEQHIERPFQQLLADDLKAGRGRRYALANQLDYLLLRAEQEQEIRSQAGIGIVDGGLDEDFFVFTRGFHANGILDDAEYALCERFYRFVRAVQPGPDLFILLDAPIQVLADRLARRNRPVEIATAADLELLQQQVNEWRWQIPAERLLVIDASTDAALSWEAIQTLVGIIQGKVSVSSGAPDVD